MTHRDSKETWTENEIAEFRYKLRRFRDDLPEGQRKAFRGLIGGSSAALRSLKRPGNGNESFGQALATFRDELPRQQQNVFTSMVTAGALAWGVAAKPDDVQTVAMWHALFTPLVIVGLGAVLIADELIEDDPEVLVPDIQIPIEGV